MTELKSLGCKFKNKNKKKKKHTDDSKLVRTDNCRLPRVVLRKLLEVGAGKGDLKAPWFIALALLLAYWVGSSRSFSL